MIFQHRKPNPFGVGIDLRQFLFRLQFRKYDHLRSVFGIPFAINGLWQSNNPELNRDHGHPVRKREAPPSRRKRLERADVNRRFARFLL